ncbi:prolyl oligopeptidase family serine peptidase [Nostoc sp. FACHB-152]|uniref:carboxylesterase family protein n=1 Tax=unclassified Nostoc TaxID=2593658 RepID=UPI001683EC0E|nr:MULTISPECIES: prolyl oligopeptidase family serine peptidase [unclassified Nostoc]MBD2449353.1 prolyl oligopeptidase family serine peptidase [Nostoc sp. FACHB-152]MBD2472932.1 prolyl oligopeptidase family serine peptidase [Nostoc sp. FACHB-145]
MDSTQQQVISHHSYNYLLFLPKNDAAKGQLLPTIVFLHGSGERGSNLDDVKRHGIAKVVEEQPDFPFITISPQCPRGQFWLVNKLSILLDEALAAYPIDSDRIYLTGLSMGGYGTWRWSAAEPQKFAAIAPVCGGGEPHNARNLKNLPVWAFHGEQDDIVPLSESEEMVAALKACGGNIKFTVYPEADHDSWTQTYNNPQLYEWFLQHQRQYSRG